MTLADHDTLAARLSSAEPGARRVAILDLMAESASDDRATAALLSHLPRERDDRAAILIIRHFARAGAHAAMPTLLSMYLDPATPAAAAHAAINAHDALAARQ